MEERTRSKIREGHWDKTVIQEYYEKQKEVPVDHSELDQFGKNILSSLAAYNAKQ